MVEKRRVYNVNEGSRIPAGAVYVGRWKGPRWGDGRFGNPIFLKREADRERVLEEYREYLEKRLQKDREFRLDVAELAGKPLICHCYPKACHASILAEMADELTDLGC